MSVWKPHVTVAGILERDGRFLLVEEAVDGELVLNQPAGHLEPNESLIEACVREVLEESGHEFRPSALIGVYRWQRDSAEDTYLRFAFAGEVGDARDDPLDIDVVRTLWLTAEEVRASTERHRSPLVLRCVEDFLAGRRLPLDVLVHLS